MITHGVTAPVIPRASVLASLRLSGVQLPVVATARVYTCGITPYDVTHLGHAGQGGAKMAKSTGNLTLVADLLRDHSPAAVRLLLLDRPWHTAWEYRPSDLDRVEGRLERIYAAAGRSGGDGDAATVAVTAALLDDLDVPRAIEAALDGGGEAARLLLRVLALT